MSINNNITAKTKASLICGMIGPMIFILMFIIQAICRDDYNSLLHPVSSLSIGAPGWIQVLSFLITGTLVLIFGAGLFHISDPLKSKWGPRLICLCGIGFIGAGIFTTDPVYGYPPDLPLVIAQFTLTGHLHDLFSIFVFVTLPIVIFKYGKLFRKAGKRNWSIYSTISGFILIAAFLMAAVGFKQIHPLNEFAGLSQRVSILAGCFWVVSFSFYLYKHGSENKIQNQDDTYIKESR